MIIEINNEILEKNVYEYLIVTLFIPLSLFTVTKGPPCFSTVAFFELTVTVNPLYRNTGKTIVLPFEDLNVNVISSLFGETLL